ncbi:MAG: sodium:solute symporter family transporter, partial [Gemmataceae bacterium]
VLWTDLIQFAIKLGGAALAGIFIVQAIPGGWAQLNELGTAGAKFRLTDFTHSWEPKFPLNFWAGLVGGAFFSMASHGADQLMVQRYLCARSLRSARTALIASGFVVAGQFLLFLMVGIGIWALVEGGQFALPARADGRDWKPDEMFGLYIVTQLPTGVVGLLMAAVLAAAMSTLSSSLNSSANALVMDFYKPLAPTHDEAWYVRVSRGMTIVWGLLQMGVAIAAGQLIGTQSIIEQVMKVAGLTTGLILGLFLLGALPRRVSTPAAMTGLGVGFAVVFAAWVPELRDRPILAWPWFACIGAVVTTVAALSAERLFFHGYSRTTPDGSSQPRQ